ncbi:MAG: response regulator [Actinomycetes bacterium]
MSDSIRTRPLRLVLAEDHALLRELLTIRFADEGIEVVDAVGDGMHAIAAVLRAEPDVAVIDVELPEQNGIEVVSWLRAANWQGALLLVSGHADEATVTAAVRAGATGFVDKASGLSLLVAAVRAAAEERPCVSPNVAAAWAQAVAGGASSPSGDVLERAVRGDDRALEQLRSPALAAQVRDEAAARHRVVESLRPRFAALSPREGDILVHLTEGHTADLIAELESVSVATVRTQIRSILQKLGVHSQLAAVALARRAGWPDADRLHESAGDEVAATSTWVRDPAPVDTPVTQRGRGSTTRAVDAVTRPG